MTGSLLQLKYIGDESKIFLGNPQIYFLNQYLNLMPILVLKLLIYLL